MNKDKLIKKVQNFINETQTLDIDKWAWLDISKDELGTLQDYLILLDWQDGYDKDINETFIKNGYGLNISIRVNRNMYFATDNPMPTTNNSDDIIDGCTLSDKDIEDNFKNVSEFIIDELEYAIKFDDINIKV